MTTIRKIVTSQVDGNDANSTNDNEIRPYGETSFYVDINNAGKLVLSMFDGQRTHLKSKVVGPGVLYGSNADSGDGYGFDTIKLIPDAGLHYNDGNYGNDQYLIVDPTSPNHIHIRAGGTQDASTAELFLGGELTNVKVSDSSDSVTIRTSDTSGGSAIPKEWIFDNTGKLSFPIFGAIETVGEGWFGITNGESGGPISILQKSINLNYVGQSLSEITLLSENENSAGTILLSTRDLAAGTLKQWTFSYDGTITMGDGVTIDTSGTMGQTNFNLTLPGITGNPQVFEFSDEGGVGAIRFPNGTYTIGNQISAPTDDTIELKTFYRPTISAEAIAGSSQDLLVVDISANDDITVLDANWEINAGSEVAPLWLPVVSTDVVPGEICSIDVPGFEFIAGFTYTFRNSSPTVYDWTFNATGTLTAPQGAIFSNETSALPKREYLSDKVVNYYWDGVSTLYIATAGDAIPAFLLTEEIETEINQLSPATNTLTLRMTDGDGNSIVGVCSIPTSINNSFSYSQLGGVPGLQFFLDVEWTSSALPAINTLTPLQRFSVDQGTYRDLNIELLEPHGQFEQRLVFRNDGSLEIPEQIQLGNILISSTQNGLTINSSGNTWTFDTNGHLNVPNEIASDQTMLGIRSNTGARLQYQDPLPLNTLGVLNQALVTVDPSGIKLETKSSDGSDPIGSIAAWTFDVDGNLTFPDATVQATAYTRSFSLLQSTGSDFTGLQGADTIQIDEGPGYTYTVPYTVGFVDRAVPGQRTVVINNTTSAVTLDFGNSTAGFSIPASTVMEVVFTTGIFFIISQRAI